MRVVALLAARNEELFIGRCLEHLYRQGVETWLIDNQSSDRTVAIAETFCNRGLIGLETLEFPGFFDLVGQLRRKEELSCSIDADWFIHHDADEIREAPAGIPLGEAIAAVDAAGFNAIDFDEFVFIPTSPAESYENSDYVDQLRTYYFFEPGKNRRVNAWRKTGGIDLVGSAGHRVEFNGRKIYPGNFVLRHYIGLSEKHLNAKYGQRVHSKEEIEDRGWHRRREQLKTTGVRLPPADAVHRLDSNVSDFRRDRPCVTHLFW